MKTRIFLSDLHAYTCGVLTGQWIDLSEVQDLEEARELAGIPSEHEHFITDYESLFEIGEYACFDDLVEKSEIVSRFDDEIELCEYVLENYIDRSDYPELDVWCDLDEMIEVCFTSPIEASKAIFFGNVYSWNDEYFYFNGYGNIESMGRYQYEELLLSYKQEFLEILWDNEL